MQNLSLSKTKKLIKNNYQFPKPILSECLGKCVCAFHSLAGALVPQCRKEGCRGRQAPPHRQNAPLVRVRQVPGWPPVGPLSVPRSSLRQAPQQRSSGTVVWITGSCGVRDTCPSRRQKPIAQWEACSELEEKWSPEGNGHQSHLLAEDGVLGRQNSRCSHERDYAMVAVCARCWVGTAATAHQDGRQSGRSCSVGSTPSLAWGHEVDCRIPQSSVTPIHGRCISLGTLASCCVRGGSHQLRGGAMS